MGEGHEHADGGLQDNPFRKVFSSELLLLPFHSFAAYINGRCARH